MSLNEMTPHVWYQMNLAPREISYNINCMCGRCRIRVPDIRTAVCYDQRRQILMFQAFCHGETARRDVAVQVFQDYRYPPLDLEMFPPVSAEPVVSDYWTSSPGEWDDISDLILADRQLSGNNFTLSPSVSIDNTVPRIAEATFGRDPPRQKPPKRKGRLLNL